MKIIFFLFLLTITLFASIGKVTSYNGKVVILRESKVLQCVVNFKLSKKDIVKTLKNSKVRILFKDKTVVTMGQKSKFNIAAYLYDESKPENSKTNFKFFKGAFRIITGKIGKIVPKRFKIETKTALIGIRGTIIVGDQRGVACTQGAIDVTSKNKTVLVPAGMITYTIANHVPTTPQQYTREEINLIESGSENNNNNYIEDQQEGSSESESEEGSSSSSSLSNVVIDSEVDNVSNIATGSVNISEQNIHSILLKDGDVEYIYIKGKAHDVKNVSDGIMNNAQQNIGTIKIK
jgi:hypothetical protein